MCGTVGDMLTRGMKYVAGQLHGNTVCLCAHVLMCQCYSVCIVSVLQCVHCVSVTLCALCQCYIVCIVSVLQCVHCVSVTLCALCQCYSVCIVSVLHCVHVY